MVIAILFSLTVVCAGTVALRTIGVAKGALSVGLTPAAGLAVLTIVSTWSVGLGAPPPWPGVAIFILALVGLVLVVADHQSIAVEAKKLAGEQRLPVVTLATALVVPLIAMGVAFAGVQVPLSPHDGAFHTEMIQAFRIGQTRGDWYPPGLAALFAAWLQGVPWLDSAEGAFDLGMALPSLAALAVFGLGVAMWHDFAKAAVSALFMSFTYIYPYFPELWSGWPLATSLVLVIGVWTVSLEYLNRPVARWGVLAGLVLGAIVLVHGTELLTLIVVLPLMLIAAARYVAWRRLPGALGFAAVSALACAAVYLPTLLHWAAGGGAYAVGLADGQSAVDVSNPTASVGADPFGVFALGALGIDAPLRVTLLAIGVVWTFRHRTRRSLVSIGLLFAAIASTFTFLSRIPAIHQLYAVTFPWGMHYRIFMVVAIVQVLLAGCGYVVALRTIERWANRPTVWARRVGRATRLIVLTWLGLMTWGMAIFLSYPAGLVLGYTNNDNAAMAWLHQNAAPAAVLANDGYADAGIWATYKAGLQVLMPRSVSTIDAARARLIIDNVARLDQTPEAAAVACALHVGYVYRGDHASEWDARRFPPVAELRAAPALEEVFASGGAIVFKLRLPCAR